MNADENVSSPKHHLSRILFHVIISIITSVFLLGFAWALLLPTRLLNIPGLTIISLIYLPLSLIRAVTAGYFARWSPPSVTLNVMGRWQGYFIGIVVGFFLGTHFLEIAGGVIGAILFFFAGRWAGTRISLGVGTYLTRFFLIDPPKESMPLITTPKGLRVNVVITYLSPLQLALLMYLLSYYVDMQLKLLSGSLDIPRIVLAIVSAALISAPWFLKPRWIKRFQDGEHSAVLNPRFSLFYFGLICSIVPAMIGFVVFVIGASLADSLVFNAVSFIAATVWLIRERDLLRTAG